MVCAVSQPDRGRGRGRKRTPSPVSARALEACVPLLRPERVGEGEAIDELARHAPDMGVVVAFGQFLPKRVRELPRLGYMINAHASLLPRHRGASPIQSAILAGDERTGISVMRVEKQMDAGAVALVRETEIGPRENAAELGDRLAQLAADAILEALDQIGEGTVHWTEQDPRRVTIAPRLSKRDGHLDWRDTTACLVRRIHALAPKPGAFTELPLRADRPAGDGQTGEPLRILRAEPAETGRFAPAEPGTLSLGPPGDPPALAIATGDGFLVPLEVQRSGGRAMETAAFLRGYALEAGERFGRLPASGDTTDG